MHIFTFAFNIQLGLSGLMGIGIPLLFVFLWSTGYVTAAYVAPYAEPLSILTLRFLGAGVLLFLFALSAHDAWPSRKRALSIIISGMMIHGIYLCGVFWGVSNGMPAGVSALLIGLQPIVTVLMAGPLLGEKTLPRHWLGLVIGLVGCAMVISPKFSLSVTGITPVTVGAHVMAVVAMVLGSIFQKRFVGAMNFKTEPWLQLVGGFLIALPVALLTESFKFTVTPQLIAGYLWMTLILSCVSFTLYMVLLQRGAASRVASVFYLVPALSAVQGYFLFNEVLTFVQLVGMTIATGAVMLASDFLYRQKKTG